ncbi:hypothetical protein [Actinomadura sp. 7K507]|uniref:hypothetical protein n=1 Tax=Actinomadura sp. 7K507 TaxID=2530365 RepID=UPI001048977E|nr:hypothetical protein [Actinomadura sp. 7K507]TDC77445.1 hypothetical protein E1285_38715 [Actinomadura sp. 7K507]
MTDRTDATVLALDAYEQHLLGDLANGHRNDHTEAEGLLHSLVIDLINYGQGNHLNMADLLDALAQARNDRGGALTNPRYSFRLNTEVQFRDRDTDEHRGFITELKSTGPGTDAECVLRVPGIIDPQHTSTSELQPATRMAPVQTRTSGTTFSALEAEHTAIDLINHLTAGSPGEPGHDPRVLADLVELSTALANWSGTMPERVLRHLRHQAGQHRPAPGDNLSSAIRQAAAAFPNDIAASLAREQPDAPSSSRPDPPRPAPHPRLK